jgi:hypothetical protein
MSLLSDQVLTFTSLVVRIVASGILRAGALLLTRHIAGSATRHLAMSPSIRSKAVMVLYAGLALSIFGARHSQQMGLGSCDLDIGSKLWCLTLPNVFRFACGVQETQPRLSGPK